MTVIMTGGTQGTKTTLMGAFIPPGVRLGVLVGDVSAGWDLGR